MDQEVAQRWLHGRWLRTSNSTVNLEIKGLRAFYRYASVFHDVPASEMTKIPRMRKVPPRLPRFLTDEDIGLVLGRLPLDTFVGVRDYAMILTLYATGIRASELVGMSTGHLLSDGMLYVRGKGGYDRYVPTGDTLGAALQGYLHARLGLRPGKLSAFWLTHRGVPLRNGRSVWEIVSRRIWQALGIEGGLTRVSRGGKPWHGHFPHELRASFATELLKSGCPLPAIAEMMGHASMETTSRYLGVDLAQMRKAISKHPRGLRQNGMSSSAGQSPAAGSEGGGAASPAPAPAAAALPAWSRPVRASSRGPRSVKPVGST